MYSSFYYDSCICQWHIQPLCSPGSNTITSYLSLLSPLFCNIWTRGSRHWISRAQNKAITIPKAVFLWSFTGGTALTSSFSCWKSTMTLHCPQNKYKFLKPIYKDLHVPTSSLQTSLPSLPLCLDLPCFPVITDLLASQAQLKYYILYEVQVTMPLLPNFHSNYYCPLA